MFGWLTARLKRRPKWLTPEMEQTISECLSGTEKGSQKVNIPTNATTQDAALCRAVHHYLNDDRKEPEPIHWHDADAEQFIKYLIQGEFDQPDPDIVNAESVVVFEAIRQAFTFEPSTALSVDSAFVAGLASFTVIALQYDSFERINDRLSRTLIANALHSLLDLIGYCIRENFNFHTKNKRYFVGQLELPAWLVEKYKTPQRP